MHRLKGPGLIESIYEKCLVHELGLRGLPAVNQRLVKIEYKGLVFEEPLRFDVLVGDCLVDSVAPAEQRYCWAQLDRLPWLIPHLSP